MLIHLQVLLANGGGGSSFHCTATHVLAVIRAKDMDTHRTYFVSMILKSRVINICVYSV